MTAKPTHLLVTAIVLASAAASAQSADTAQAAFKRGHAAMTAGRIHDACDAFAASDKLAAETQTELALADCLEQDGKPMSAARAYRKVAEHDTNMERSKQSTAKAVKLEARAPKLRFAINPRPPGLVLEVDGVEVSASDDLLVDTGPHEVIATAPGYEGHAQAPVDRERSVLDVIVRMEPKAEPAPAPAAVPSPAEAARAAEPAPAPALMPADAPRASTDHRRRNGLILGAGGLGVLVGAAIVWEASSSRFDDVTRLCPSDTCPDATALSEAKSKQDDGHTLRGVSIGMGIGGALLVAAGSYLALTPHREDSHVALHVEHGGGSVGYTTRF
jgi:hypothetical protein